jgi:transcriptional regulator with XRE-family HTH domain
MRDSSQTGICRRIRQVRTEVAGHRGKSLFAKKLGLAPSTYEYYEGDRVPPAGVLVRIAEIAGIDLRWLLTGEALPDAGIPASHPVVQRVGQMLSDRPDAAKPLAAFLDILAESLSFPSRPDATAPERPLAVPPPVAASAREAWIPILGRSAAGVPRFWSQTDSAAGLTTLAELVARQARRRPNRVQPGAMSGQEEGGPVQIISLSAPEGETAEFVAAPAVKSRHHDAFAVRIDGESMAPEIRHGDVVILSPSVPAVDGRPAVVQLARQIGVTCKLYRREAQAVHLVPINEQFAPQVVPAESVVWAMRVLASVRPAE